MNKEKIVRQVSDVADAVNDMNRAMAAVPDAVSEKKLKIAEFHRKYPNVKYLEPVTQIPTQGVKHPEMEKQREYLHEYVTGILESQLITGALDFFLTGLPGDPYCRWIVPVNKPVGVPRFLAQHLNKNLGWKQMKPLTAKEPSIHHAGEEDKPFQEFETMRRANFHPINSY